MTGERPVIPDAESMVTGAATAVGYINAELLSDKRLELARRGLHAWSASLGIELAAVLVEDDAAARLTLRDLHDEIRARDARYVLIPGLAHLSTHPLLQGERVDSLQHGGAVTVLPVDAYTTAARLAL